MNELLQEIEKQCIKEFYFSLLLLAINFKHCLKEDGNFDERYFAIMRNHLRNVSSLRRSFIKILFAILKSSKIRRMIFLNFLKISSLFQCNILKFYCIEFLTIPEKSFELKTFIRYSILFRNILKSRGKNKNF